MQSSDVKDQPVLRKMADSLEEALGDRLVSIVLYGSAARGDYHKETSDFNLLLVLQDLDPPTLEAVTPVVSRWVDRGQPFPRLFTPSLISDSADVFPIEFLDIKAHHLVLRGTDPVAGVTVHQDHLRLQCERELREKMMRLREGYVQARGKSQLLKRLMTDSYTTFIALFRGCLYLLGGPIPTHNEDVVEAFCSRAELDRAPFEEVLRLKRGEKKPTDARRLFSRYYAELTQAVLRVDRFRPDKEGGIAL